MCCWRLINQLNRARAETTVDKYLLRMLLNYKTLLLGSIYYCCCILQTVYNCFISLYVLLK